jgi:Flp pilus assembly pilin Flp
MSTLRRLIRRARDERGAAIIEFALVAPLLLTLVWGIIETGRAFYTINSLASAVRDGARYGAATCPLLTSGPGAGSPAMDLCRPAIQNVVITAFQPIGNPLTTTNVLTTAQGSGPDTRIEVIANYPYSPIVPVAGWNITISRRAVFRYERLP